MGNNNVIINSTAKAIINNTEDRERGIACIRLAMGTAASMASGALLITNPISGKFTLDDYNLTMLAFFVRAVGEDIGHAEDYGVMWGVDEDTTKSIIMQEIGKAMKDLNKTGNNLVAILREKRSIKAIEELNKIEQALSIIEAIDNLYDEMNSKYSFSV